MKLITFALILLGIALFIGILAFTLGTQKPPSPNTTKRHIKKEKKQKRANTENPDNIQKFSEIKGDSEHTRAKKKEKYPYTETLTTLLDFEDENGSPDDFTTSLLSERDLGNKGQYTEINFDDEPSIGEIIETEVDSVDSIEQRTMLLDALDLEEEDEDFKTSLLFEENENNESEINKEDLIEEKEIEKVVEDEDSIKNPAIEEKKPLYIEESFDQNEGIFDIENQEQNGSSAKENIKAIENAIYTNMSFNGQDFGDLENAIFINCKITDCKFIEKNLKKVRFIKTRISKSSFLGAEMQEVLFDESKVYNSSFKYAGLENSKLINSVFNNCVFNKADLNNSLIENSHFPKSSIERGVNFNEKEKQ